jgi:hypothetical protein
MTVLQERPMRAANGIALLLCGLLLAACDGPSPGGAATADAGAGAESTTPGKPGAPAEPQAEDFGEFKVAALLLGNALGADQVVRADATEFAAGDALHASVLSTGAHPGLTLSARWLAPDGAIIADTAQAIAPSEPTATTFTLKNPDGWPPGDYTLQLRANNTLLETRAFAIR